MLSGSSFLVFEFLALGVFSYSSRRFCFGLSVYIYKYRYACVRVYAYVLVSGICTWQCTNMIYVNIHVNVLSSLRS